MFNKLRRNWMGFKNLFDDKNDINEKSVVGFIAFAGMVVFAFADLLTGYLGKDLVIFMSLESYPLGRVMNFWFGAFNLSLSIKTPPAVVMTP